MCIEIILQSKKKYACKRREGKKKTIKKTVQVKYKTSSIYVCTGTFWVFKSLDNFYKESITKTTNKETEVHIQQSKNKEKKKTTSYIILYRIFLHSYHP